MGAHYSLPYNIYSNDINDSPNAMPIAAFISIPIKTFNGYFSLDEISRQCPIATSIIYSITCKRKGTFPFPYFMAALPLQFYFRPESRRLSGLSPGL